MWPFKKKSVERPTIDTAGEIGEIWKMVSLIHMRVDQWTGLHQRMEQLFQLGIAIEKVKYTLPKELWSALPGGMPYLMIDL